MTEGPALSLFVGGRRLACVSHDAVLAELRRLGPEAPPALVFDDATGAVVDLDLGATAAPASPAEEPARRPRGRPKIGVVAREVTLLPRHWDWLVAQPGGASQALRRLVEAARLADDGRTAARQARERSYRFLSAIAGDLPGFEAASRALFAGDAPAFAAAMAGWPPDVAAHAIRLAEPAPGAGGSVP